MAVTPSAATSASSRRSDEGSRRGHQYRQGQFQPARIDGYVNIPVSDTLQLRVSGVFQRHDGYVRSTTSDVVLNDLNENAQRVVLKWKPDSRLEVTLRAGTWRRDDAGAGSYGYKVAGTLINPATGYQSINGSPLAVNPRCPTVRPTSPGAMSACRSPAARGPTMGLPAFEHIKEDYVSGQIAYDLGFATVKSITGYTHFRAHRSADNDQSSKVFEAYGYGSGIQEPNTRSNAFSQEMQLASNSRSPLEWLIGGYYLHDSIFETYQQKITAPGATTNGFKADSDITTNAYAAFGQASYAIVPDKLKLIGGLRYSHEKKAFIFSDYADAAPGTYNFVTPYVTTKGSPGFNSWTWRAGIQFTPSRSTMIYATASTGFASGGVNDTGGNPLIPASYAPQKVSAYEAASSR
jgi:iron complex outermembrane receptor protein